MMSLKLLGNPGVKLGEAVWNRFKGGKEGSWYYRALVQAFQETGGGLIAQLEQVVNELEHLIAIATKPFDELI